MASLEYRLLKAGEEEAALNFFYSNFVAKEGQLCSVGAGRNEEVTRDMQAMLTSGTLYSRLQVLDGTEYSCAT